ncbi:MAG: hypothetical protein ACOH2M_00950 [Cypionkella sp.]
MHLRHFTLPLLLVLSLASPMQADLLITGRAAQALHCSAMLLIVSDLLAEAQMIEPRTAQNARIGAVLMLDQVPGTRAQKMQAMRQRSQRIAASRSLPYLLKEYTSTTKWCNAHFLPKG